MAPNSKRRQLLPLWIKVISVVMMLFGVLSIVAFLLEFIGIRIPLSIYGMWSEGCFNPVGVIILTAFLLCGLSGLMLWHGHKNAIRLTILNSILGITLCVFTGFVYPFIDSSPSVQLTFRLEIIVLAFMLNWGLRMQRIWEVEHSDVEEF